MGKLKSRKFYTIKSHFRESLHILFISTTTTEDHQKLKKIAQKERTKHYLLRVLSGGEADHHPTFISSFKNGVAKSHSNERFTILKICSCSMNIEHCEHCADDCFYIYKLLRN